MQLSICAVAIIAIIQAGKSGMENNNILDDGGTADLNYELNL